MLLLDNLKCFYEDEVEAMLCGQGEQWTVEKLADALKFDHGCAVVVAQVSGSRIEDSSKQCELRRWRGSGVISAPFRGAMGLSPRMTSAYRGERCCLQVHFDKSIGSAFPGDPFGAGRCRSAPLSAVCDWQPPIAARGPQRTAPKVRLQASRSLAPFRPVLSLYCASHRPAGDGRF